MEPPMRIATILLAVCLSVVALLRRLVGRIQNNTAD